MLTGKVCIVTGGSRGIGKAISQVFAQNGAIVYIIDIREGSAEEWSEEFNQGVRGEIRALYCDISDEKSAKDVIMQIKRTCGHIDGLVNNAGVEFNELIGMISRDNMEKMFSVNVYCKTGKFVTISLEFIIVRLHRFSEIVKCLGWHCIVVVSAVSIIFDIILPWFPLSK